MKSITIVFVLFTVFLAVLVVPVHASVSVTSTIGDSVYVVYDFQNLNSTVYDEIKAIYQFNISTTISTAIVKNLEAQGQKQVQSSLGPETGEFDDVAKSIHVSFYIWDSDIITFEFPLNFWDVFINSPFLILAVLIIIVIIALIYRKIR